eukprot:scaffold54828_cov30-Tisochrysis_lutea.AAC.2
MLGGHEVKHCVPYAYFACAAGSQLRQSVDVRPLHVPHDASHVWQRMWLSTNVPSGHEATQAPSCKKKASGLARLQLVHTARAAPSARMHVLHDESQATHVPFEARNSLRSQGYMQTPDVKLPPRRQVTQSVGSNPVHVPQVSSHGTQTPFVSAKLSSGHTATQEPPSAYGVPDTGQDVHAVDCASTHVSHDSWHGAQESRPVAASSFTKVPRGQLSRQEDACWYGMSPRGSQDRQELFVGPLQVPQLEAQGWQVREMRPPKEARTGYLPTGVQDARQALPSAKGYAGAHETHWSLLGPEHVAQLSWHGTHTSAALALPPEHVQPSAMAEHARHAEDGESPSSQASWPTRRPSPHRARHKSLVRDEPPEHSKPGSISQEGPQPSPGTVLLSSQASLISLPLMRMPSPHTGMHSSRPPTPSKRFMLRQAHPGSMLQNGLQPSPPIVELSSHCSAVVRTPFPHTCATCITGRLPRHKTLDPPKRLRLSPASRCAVTEDARQIEGDELLWPEVRRVAVRVEADAHAPPRAIRGETEHFYRTDGLEFGQGSVVISCAGRRK